MMELSELLHPNETHRSTKPPSEESMWGSTRAWHKIVDALPSSPPTTARTTMVPEVTVSASHEVQTEGANLTAISHQAVPPYGIAPSPIGLTSHSDTSLYAIQRTANALTYSPAAHDTSATSKNILFQAPWHNTTESSREALARQMAMRVPSRFTFPLRSPVACTQCRTRKRKCKWTDPRLPCISCEKRKTRCEYTTVKGGKAYFGRSSVGRDPLTQTTQLESTSADILPQSSWNHQNLQYQNPLPQPHGPDQGDSWQYVSPSAYSASQPAHDPDQSLASRPSLPSIRDLKLPYSVQHTYQ